MFIQSGFIYLVGFWFGILSFKKVLPLGLGIWLSGRVLALGSVLRFWGGGVLGI